MKSPKRQKQLLLAKSARTYLAGASWRQKARLFGSQAASQLRTKTARQTRNPWEEWEIQMVGRYSDQELARRIGRGRSGVARKRMALGIPPFSPHQKWVPREIRFLTDHPGEFTDAELSRKLGRSRHSVGNKRKELGLPPKRRPLQWTRKTLALLGQLSDCELARRLNVSRNTVGRKRMELNIPPSQTGRHWTKKEELAIQPGKSRTAVRWKRGKRGIVARHSKPAQGDPN